MRFIFKWFPRIFFAALVLFVLLGAITWFLNKAEQPPKIEDAPWAIQTYSFDEMRVPARIYYARDVKMLEDGTPVIINYWSYDGHKFHHTKGEKQFPKAMYGSVGLRMRALP